MNIQTTRYYPLTLSLLSGCLLGLGWYAFSAYFIVIALVPIFLLEKHIREKTKRFKALKLGFYSFLSFSLWNWIVLWWLWESIEYVSLAAWFANALLQTIPILAVYFINQKTNKQLGMFVWVVCWMAFEYLHFHWDLSWVWLNLGNTLNYYPKLAQWYEYTGIFGGTLWILICNIFVFSFFEKKTSLLPFSISLIVPILISLSIYYSYEEKGFPAEVVVVQPNIDCYTEKFSYNAKTHKKNPNPMPYNSQIERYIQISKTYLTDSTKFLLFPETALHVLKLESQLSAYSDVQKIQNLAINYPNLGILLGMDSYISYGKVKPDNSTYRYSENVGYYDVFNSALFLKDSVKIGIYRKSKLVLGAETMPFQKFLKTIVNLGGIGGSLGKQKEPTTFFNQKNDGIAPIICYESIYGEYVTQYVTKGAKLLGVITNDGWWGNTPGHRQHFAFSRLRALENRRSLARSANTGISAFINQRGDIVSALPYGTQDAIKERVLLNDRLTFYTRYGDYLGRGATFIALIFGVYALATGLMRTKKK